jgi:hypothetical protein
MLNKQNEVVVFSEGAVYRGVRSERAWSWVWLRDVPSTHEGQTGTGSSDRLAGTAQRTQDRAVPLRR